MSARLRATLLAAILLVAFAFCAVVQPTGFALLSPGPTVNTLGANDDQVKITVTGHKTYPDSEGQLRMLTVYEMGPQQELSLASGIQHWLSDPMSVYPKDFLYPTTATTESNNEEGAAEMTSAQDLSKVAALRALGYDVPGVESVAIAGISAGGPSEGKLKVGDIVTSVNGEAVSTTQALQAAIRKVQVGDVVNLVVTRDGKATDVAIKTAPKGPGVDAKTPRIGVSIAPSQKFTFPIDIKVEVSPNIQGPSAGMMFALTIYDLLTPGSLTGGRIVAGTGTIDAQGKVGPIGGIAQKIRGAQRDGAQLFLAPASNCDEVVHAEYDHSTMTIAKVATLKDAINAVTAWTKDPKAPVKGCS